MAINTENEDQHIKDLTDWPNLGEFNGPFSWTGNSEQSMNILSNF